MNKKIIIGIIAVAIIAVGVLMFLNLKTGAPKLIRETPVEENGEIRKLLVVCEHFPPFTVEENGVVVGIHADVLKLVMERIGVPYELRIVPWSRALRMMEEGATEALLTCAYTEGRDEWAYYAEDQKLANNKILPKAYVDALDMVFFIRKVNEGGYVFESFDQIAEYNYRIGLDANYAYADDVLEAGWNTVYRPTLIDNIQALYEGKIDMYLQDKIAGLGVIKELGFEDEITYIEKPPMTFIYYLPFSENSDYPDLKNIWEQTLVELEEIQRSGVIDEIYKKHGQEQQ